MFCGLEKKILKLCFTSVLRYCDGFGLSSVVSKRFSFALERTARVAERPAIYAWDELKLPWDSFGNYLIARYFCGRKLVLRSRETRVFVQMRHSLSVYNFWKRQYKCLPDGLYSVSCGFMVSYTFLLRGWFLCAQRAGSNVAETPKQNAPGHSICHKNLMQTRPLGHWQRVTKIWAWSSYLYFWLLRFYYLHELWSTLQAASRGLGRKCVDVANGSVLFLRFVLTRQRHMFELLRQK